MLIEHHTTKAIAQWQKKTFGPLRSVAGAAAHLKRECDEILEMDHSDKNALAEEIADAYFLFVQMAQLMEDIHGIDIGTVILDKLRKNRSRTWNEPDAEGVVEHVRGEGENAK